MTAHGYNAYTHGCRCDTCRAAKAEYSRTQRAQAKAQRPDGRTPVVGIKHGYNGYQNHYCRCYLCALASSERNPRVVTPGKVLLREYQERAS